MKKTEETKKNTLTKGSATVMKVIPKLVEELLN
jgi:hypothetical protein